MYMHVTVFETFSFRALIDTVGRAVVCKNYPRNVSRDTQNFFTLSLVSLFACRDTVTDETRRNKTNGAAIILVVPKHSDFVLCIQSSTVITTVVLPLISSAIYEFDMVHVLNA